MILSRKFGGQKITSRWVLLPSLPPSFLSLRTASASRRKENDSTALRKNKQLWIGLNKLIVKYLAFAGRTKHNMIHSQSLILKLSRRMSPFFTTLIRQYLCCTFAPCTIPCLITGRCVLIYYSSGILFLIQLNVMMMSVTVPTAVKGYDFIGSCKLFKEFSNNKWMGNWYGNNSLIEIIRWLFHCPWMEYANLSDLYL